MLFSYEASRFLGASSSVFLCCNSICDRKNNSLPHKKCEPKVSVIWTENFDFFGPQRRASTSHSLGSLSASALRFMDCLRIEDSQLRVRAVAKILVTTCRSGDAACCVAMSKLLC